MPSLLNPARVAVVGAGYFSQFHIDGWLRVPGTQLVAVADLDRGKAEVAAARADAPAFTDVDTMLEMTAPDLVDIATPPDSHLDIVARVAARGIPMICQKPLAPTLAEACRMVETAERAGVLLVAHENFRFMPWYREAARLIAAGKLGRLYGITFRLRPNDGRGPEAYLARQPYFRKLRRFLIAETAVHLIDVFRFLAGEITGVFARLHRLNPVIAGEDTGQVLFQFASGTTGLFDGNRLAGHSAANQQLTMGTMEIEGELGMLRLDGDGRWWFAAPGTGQVEHAYPWPREHPRGDYVRLLQAHVIEHMVSGSAIENTGRAYLRNMEVVEAIYRSDREGRWIDLD